jgi:hypothetical protein
MKRLLTLAILFIAYNCTAMEPEEKNLMLNFINKTGHKIRVRVKSYDGKEILEEKDFKVDDKISYDLKPQKGYRVNIFHTGTAMPKGPEYVQEPEIGKFGIYPNDFKPDLIPNIIYAYSPEGILSTGYLYEEPIKPGFVRMRIPHLVTVGTEQKELARAALIDLKDELNKGATSEQLVKIFNDSRQILSKYLYSAFLEGLEESLKEDRRITAERYIDKMLDKLKFTSLAPE